MNKKKKILTAIKFLFIPKLKFWKPTFYTFMVFIVATIAIGFSVNLNNSHLEKRVGVVDYMYNYAFRNKSDVWLNYNFKLEGDSQIYGQKIYFDNHQPFNLFLFNHFDFPAKKMLGIAKGDTLEFYIDKPPQSFPFRLVSVDNGKDYKKEKNTNETVIASYGLKANGETLFSYTKRAFVVDHSNYIYAIFALFFIPLIAGLGYNLVQKMGSVRIYLEDLELKEQILAKIPLLEETFRPIVLDESLTLPQKIVNLRKFAPIGSNRFELVVHLARNYWFDLNEYDKAEELYRALIEAYPNNMYAWDGYYSMLEKQKRKKDLYAFEEKLYALDASNAEMFARWYESAAKSKRYKYWKKRIVEKQTKNEKNVKDRTFANKMMRTCLIHIINAIIVFCVCSNSQLYNFIYHNTLIPQLSWVSLAPIMLAPIFIAFIWGKGIISTLGNVRKKIPLSLWVIFNYFLAVAYSIAIHMHFY